MKTLWIIIFQLLLAFSTSAQMQKFTTANLNLRAEPTTSSKVKSTIPAGTSVELSEDCDCPWIQVLYNGQVGYVSAKYLSTAQPIQQFRSPSPTSISKGVRYYINSAGERVQSPTHYDTPPKGATALCRDGTYSFSRNRRGTCSGHGGVARWL